MIRSCAICGSAVLPPMLREHWAWHITLGMEMPALEVSSAFLSDPESIYAPLDNPTERKRVWECACGHALKANHREEPEGLRCEVCEVVCQ